MLPRSLTLVFVFHLFAFVFPWLPAQAQIHEHTREALVHTREAAAHETAATRWTEAIQAWTQAWTQARAAWVEEEDMQRHKQAAEARDLDRGEPAEYEAQMRTIMKARTQARDRGESANANVYEAQTRARAQWVEAAQAYVRAARAHEAAARTYSLQAIEARAQAQEQSVAVHEMAAAEYEAASQAREAAATEYEAARAHEAAGTVVQIPETSDTKEEATLKYVEARGV